MAATGAAVAAGIATTGEEPASATSASSASSIETPAAGAPSTGIPLSGISVTGIPASEVTGAGDRALATLRVPQRVAPAELDRARVPSRSGLRTAVAPVKKAALGRHHSVRATATEDPTRKDPRSVARAMLPAFGFGSDQFTCLNSIYVNESGWNVHADNPSSSAYGIPQALPGSKMSSAGPDWQNNPVTQIRWGLGYIKARYGTPCNAWGFKQGHGWY